MEFLRASLKLFMKQKTTIGYSVMAFMTIGGEQIFSVLSFQCPCDEQNFFYGVTFLLAPFVMLLVLCLFFSTKLWWEYTGCCRELTAQIDCTIFMRAIMRALVVPIIWLCAALLNGTFIQCAASGRKVYCQKQECVNNMTEDCLKDLEDCFKELVKVTCDKDTVKSKEKLLMFLAESQLIGWWLIVGAAIAGLFVLCLNFCSQESYSQRTYKTHYAEKMKEQFDAAAVVKAGELVKSKLESFFERNRDPFGDTKQWEDISPYSRWIGGDIDSKKQTNRKNEMEEGQDNDAMMCDIN